MGLKQYDFDIFSRDREDEKAKGHCDQYQEVCSHWLRIKFQAVKENTTIQRKISDKD